MLDGAIQGLSAKPSRQIDAKFSRLESTIDDLVEIAKLLENKVSAVRLPQPSVPAQNIDKTPSPALCGIADRLNGFTSRVNNVVIQLRTLTDEIEL